MKKKILILATVSFVFIFWFLYSIVGFNHLPGHIENLKANGLGEIFNFSDDKSASKVPILTELATQTNNIVDYDKLKIANEKPTGIEAQSAIVRFYGDEVVNLLKTNKAHIMIGECYVSPLKSHTNGDKEVSRVTGSICGFDDQNHNLGNISMPITYFYDFVKYESDPEHWYITDPSQKIPFDEKFEIE